MSKQTDKTPVFSSACPSSKTFIHLVSEVSDRHCQPDSTISGRKQVQTQSRLGTNHAITKKHQGIILNKQECDLNLTWKVSLKEKSLEMAFERGFGFMHQILTRTAPSPQKKHLTLEGTEKEEVAKIVSSLG